MGSHVSHALKQKITVDNLYSCAPFFMIRTALLPIDNNYQSINEKYLIAKYLTEPLLREAIAIATPSLHQTLKIKETVPDFAILSLLKYYLRMTTRATPFGLFSSVGYGQFSENLKLTIDWDHIQKHIRPDMEWINGLKTLWYQDPNIVQHLKVVKNPLVSFGADRVFLIQGVDLEGGSSLISIRRTKFVDYIFHETTAPILYKELEGKTKRYFFEYDQELVSNCLWQIFQKNYLISELSPQLDLPFSFNDFVQKITQETLDYKQKLSLNKICEMMEAYEKTNLGEGIDLLEEIQNKSLSIVKASCSMQVDSCFSTSVQLPHLISASIEKAAGALFGISHVENSSKSIKNYHTRFLEKYGTNRLVSVLELTDPHKGLGFPEKNRRDQKPNSLREILIQSLCTGSVGKEVVLNDLYLDGKVVDQAPLSMELFFELDIPSTETLNPHNFTVVVNPLSASMQAGSTLGRFLPFFDKTKKESVKKFLSEEEALYPDTCFVEASFLPQNPRTANVCFYEKVRNFQLLLHYHNPSSSFISLEDIYVGASTDFLYLYAKSIQKWIQISLSTAVNPDLAPAILKLLLDISSMPFCPFYPFLWHNFGHLPYLPRVRYENIILNPARWCFNLEILNVSKLDSYKKVLESLKEMLKKYNVPESVYLCNLDNKLKLNLSNTLHIKLLIQQILNKGEVVLLESCITNFSGMIKSSKGSHSTEFVAFLKRKIPVDSKKLIDTNSLYQTFTTKDRYVLPGKEWIYVKLFVFKEAEESFLKKHLAYFISIIESLSLVKMWFYIRYQEDKSHIRLRIYAPGYYANVMEQLYRWAEDLMENGFLADLSLHTYEKEIDRYGGPHPLSIAESFFHTDSQSAIQLLTIAENYSISLDVIVAIGILHLLSFFYETHEQIAEFLLPMKAYSYQLSKARLEIRQGVEWAHLIIVESSIIDKHLPPFINEIKQSFDATKETLQQYRRSITQEPILNNHIHIIDSIIHMRCNRLLGIAKEKEQKARVLALEIIQKLKSFAKRSV